MGAKIFLTGISPIESGASATMPPHAFSLGKSTASSSMAASALLAALPVGACLLLLLLLLRWVSPRRIAQTMQRQGIRGPRPRLLLGNLFEIKQIARKAAKLEANGVSHNIERWLFPHFVQWKRTYGKMFVYWVGTEAVLYVQEPEVIREMSLSGSINWGRPSFLKDDRYPLFGNGLIMAEAEHWIHQRRIVGRALAPDKFKGLFATVVESVASLLDEWAGRIAAGGGECAEIEVDGELNKVTSQVISKLLFGRSYAAGSRILHKLRILQETIFNSARLVGVPGGRFIPTPGNRQARKVGKEADRLIMELITARRAEPRGFRGEEDLLGLLLSELENTQDVVDQCKTLLIAGQETTKLSLTWTLMLLALNPPWQDRVRAEVMEATRGGADPLDIDMLAKMKTMTMVVKEAMRLYPPVAYTVRQAKQEMRVGDLLIPKGMSVVINIVGLHHDPHIWGDDVYEFHPQRFSACNANQLGRRSGGFIPFGFGGRICAGERLANIEQKVVLSMILSTFAFSISPNYVHSPTTLLSIMPSQGMCLRFHKL